MQMLKLRSPYMRGADVITFQTWVTNHGFPCGKIDGIYGPKSANACRSFQRANSGVVDGICGPITWGALLKITSINPILTRVGSWNIKRGYGDIDAQQAFLAQQHPLIMDIQEVYVRSSKGIDNLKSLTTDEMDQTAFAPTIYFGSGAMYGIGNLSHYPLINPTSTDMYSNGYEHRIFTRCTCLVNDRMVSVYNTHFSFESSSIRFEQFEAVLDAMDADSSEYKILSGDFNTRDFSAIGSDYIVIFSGIDNIIVSRNIGIHESYTVKTALSDHNPVFADLLIGQ